MHRRFHPPPPPPHPIPGMDCSSEYIYDRQPPSVIVCNPYINRALHLDCAIMGPSTVQLQWYFSPDLNLFNSILLRNSSRFQLGDLSDLDSNSPVTRVGLTVRGLSAASDNVATGYYWCQGSVPGGKLTPSGKVKLYSAEYYKYIKIGCLPRIYLRSSNKGCPVLLPSLQPSALSTAPRPSKVTSATQNINTPTPAPVLQATPSSDSKGGATGNTAS